MNAILFPDLLAGSTCSVDELKMGYLQNIPYTIFIKFKLNTLARHYVSAHYFTFYVLQHVSALIEPSSGRYNSRDCTWYMSIHLD